MNTNYVTSLCISIVLFGSALCSRAVALSADEVAQSIAFWQPRRADLGSLESPDAKKLDFMLRHALTKKYIVKAGDNLDHIIREHYYLSTKDQRLAFGIYGAVIRELNGLSKDSVLQPGQTLDLPTGPKYGALELSAGVLSSWFFEHASALEEYAEERYTEYAKVGLATTRPLPKDLVRQKVHEQIGFKVPSQTGEALADKNIVPPLTWYAGPMLGTELLNNETVSLKTTAAESSIVGAIPAFLPASLDLSSSDIDCHSHCTPCRSLLNGHTLEATSSVRIVIADSGIDTTVVPNQRFLYPQPTATADAAPNKHGTFVYSEISASKALGVINDGQLLVSSVVGIKPGESQISWKLEAFPEMVKAVTDQRESMKHSSSDYVTIPPWIVNVSASGQAPADIPVPPFLGGGPRGNGSMLLFVAAAGNNSGGDDLLQNILFASLNNPSLLIVGATDENGHVASYSNRSSSKVDILARGSCVCGFGATNNGTAYVPGSVQLSGTSQAAPLVSAVAAILSNLHPHWFASDVKSRLVSTGRLDEEFGEAAIGGLIDIDSALRIGSQVTICTSATSCETHQALKVSFGMDSLLKRAVPQDLSNLAILRLHAIKCNDLPGFTCFRVIHKEQINVPLKVLLPTDGLVSYVENGVAKKAKVADLKDLVLPVNQRTETDGFIIDLDAQ